MARLTPAGKPVTLTLQDLLIVEVISIFIKIYSYFFKKNSRIDGKCVFLIQCTPSEVPGSQPYRLSSLAMLSAAL